MRINVILGLTFVLSSCGNIYHHSIFSNFKSLERRADKHTEQYSYAEAVELYKRALVKDTSNIQLKLKIANSYRMLNNPKESEYWYRKAVYKGDALSPIDQLHYAQTLMANGHYQESKEWFYKYHNSQKIDSQGMRKLEGIDSLHWFYQDSSSYSIKPVSISTQASDFSPAYYSGGIVFVSSRSDGHFVKRKSTRDDSNFYDLFYSTITQGGDLSEPEKFHQSINDKLHEGPVTFYGNDTRMIFTKSGINKIQIKSNEHVNRLMLFSAEKDYQGEWGNVQPMPFNDLSYSVGHPSISKDEQVLYFASDMPGGCGGTDIYKSIRLGEGWSKPVNLGAQINTSGNELFPYISADNVLYFSSSGYGGLGGLDIYRTKLVDSIFKEVQNLGYPINSSQDDFGITFLPDRRSGYFSSNRNGLVDNLFYFQVLKIQLEGSVVARLKGKSLQGVTVSLMVDGIKQDQAVSNRDGSFVLSLDPDKKYDLLFTKEDFKTMQVPVSTVDLVSGEPLSVKAELEKSQKVIIKGVVRIDSTTVVPNAVVYYKIKESGLVDSTIADEKGEFHCEIESNIEYIYYTTHNRLFGKVNIKSTSKKGSVLYYLNIEMKEFYTREIEGVARDSSGVLDKVVVVVQERFTGKVDSVYSNSEGRFKFNATTFGDYKISAFKNNLSFEVDASFPKEIIDPKIELYLKTEN